MENEENLEKELGARLAVAFWQFFEYSLPIDPASMSKFVMTQIGLAGYKVVKG